MGSKDKSPPSNDDTLQSLMDEAEKAKTATGRRRKTLNIKDAEETLNSLVEEAGGAESINAKGEARGHTRAALDAIFEEHRAEITGGPGILVGLDDEGGVDGSMDESMDEEPTLAGAESAEKSAKPVRKLDDGVDFWNELETIDQDFDPDQ